MHMIKFWRNDDGEYIEFGCVINRLKYQNIECQENIHHDKIQYNIIDNNSFMIFNEILLTGLISSTNGKPELLLT